MADNSRIEDLRKRYHENPRRFFAPLANEYRKAGLLDRALLLCQKHVPEQPENMNGLVVFGQTLFESGNLEAAREPFERALGLDPENLIALRHLGDIARLGDDLPTARRWYERVLELDRRNDEVLDLLAAMGGDEATPAEPAASAAPPARAADLISVGKSVAVSGLDAGDGLGLVDLDLPTPPAPAAPAVPKTVVIDAQALAAKDRRDAESSSAPTVEVTAQPKPNKRASLLDIDFDFGEIAETPSAAAALAAATGAETLRIEPSAPSAPPPIAAPFAVETTSDAGTLSVETTADAGALGVETTADAGTLSVETTGDVAPLGLEPTIVEAPAPPPAAAPAPEFELAEFSSDAAPLAGLETTEFTGGEVAPLAGLGGLDDAFGGESLVEPTVPALPEPTTESLLPPDEEPIAEPLFEQADASAFDLVAGPIGEAPMGELPMGGGLEPAVEPASAAEPQSAPSAEPLSEPSSTVEMDSLGLPLMDVHDPATAPPPKPRMTKADLASLPLLADFGLEDDAPAAAAPAAPVPPAQPESIAAREPLAPPVAPVDELPSLGSLGSVLPPEPPAPPRASKATPIFVTETMAALYVKQGHLEQAIDVYRKLVAQSPNDTALQSKLAELERMQASAATADAAAVDMPEFDAPEPGALEPEPAPANSALDSVSFGGIGLRASASAPTPIITPAVPAGPTAREFFGSFARRAVTAAALGVAVSATEQGAVETAVAELAAVEPVAEPQAEESVESVSEMMDETPASVESETPATEAVASLTETPASVDENAGAWPLDQLLGAATDVRDLHAAEVLAGVATFAGPDGGTGLASLLHHTPPGTPTRRAVPRASEMLKFDQFFQPTQAPTPPMPEPQAGDDDLDQFQDWLKGLKT